MRNPSKESQTASPDKYPQGYFKDKPCKRCKSLFTPKAPSESYCSDICKDYGVVSAYLLRNYNITQDTYLHLHNQQNGKCAICGGEGFTMGKHHKIKLVVDHCHATGRVRGLLCHNCNRALGLLHDNINHLQVAIDYLQKEAL